MSAIDISVIGRRICAAMAAGSAGLHAVLLGHAANVVAAGVLAVMITACLYCARELWLDGTVRAWVVVAMMNLAMVALHLPAPAHHGSTAPEGVVHPSTAMAVAIQLALVEVLAATVALYVRTRGRGPRPTVQRYLEAP